MDPQELVMSEVDVKGEEEGGGKASFPFSSCSHRVDDSV